MKIPTWFVIGCGLLVLNLVLVVGGTLSRHASADPPDERLKLSDQQQKSDPPTLPDAGLPDAGLPDAGLPEAGLPEAGSLPPVLPKEPFDILPTVPSLESSGPISPNIVSLDEVKNAVGELQPSTDLLAALDAIMKDSAAPVSKQLSQSFFESMKLRLKTVKHLNQSAIGLVDEAAILHQRGEIAEAQKLLGVVTQLRETTARLLVTHQ